MDRNRVVSALGNWTAARGPLYRLLADALRDAISRGDIVAGDRLPSEREFALLLNVSRTTVLGAYNLLREGGLVASRRGSGTRVTASGGWGGPTPAPGVMPSLKLVGQPSHGIIDLSASVIPTLDGLPDETLRLTAPELRRLAGDFAYEPLGLPSLRAAIAARHSTLGTPTTMDQVLITTGAQQAIDLLFALFARNGGTILMENPTYVGALDAARAVGATVVGVPTDEEGIEVRALHEELDEAPSVRLVYVMLAGQNPTGAVMGDTRRRAIGRLAEVSRTPIVDDMTLADLAFDGRTRPPLAALADDGTAITIGSFSKLFWAGLRVGWIRAAAPLVARLARLKVVRDLGSSHVSQLLASRAAELTDEVSSIRRRQLAERLGLLVDLLSEKLPRWTWSSPSAGPFLWVRLPHGDAEAFAQVALRNGVRVLPGTRLSTDATFADHLRLSFVAEPALLESALERLNRAWDAFESSSTADRVRLDVVV